MTIGQSPIGRFMHGMEYYRDGNILVLYCGRNDTTEEKILDDFWILKLSTLEW